MKLTVEEIARVCHQVNKAYCASTGDLSQPEWELAPKWQKESAVIGVQSHIDFHQLPEDSHAAWMKHKESDGWVYGETKDPEKKTHPCMVPYEQLPSAQKVKDYLFIEVVSCLKGFSE